MFATYTSLFVSHNGTLISENLVRISENSLQSCAGNYAESADSNEVMLDVSNSTVSSSANSKE